ncbi:MAG: tRNA (adenosine(37)-N6)-threonylcarbamoyltransferase complex ATPase subunit type 1 TsaE [Treponema sp.]|jgi:tRNA threonylcarbamoyladenosine biosynthesis protein TsaE|nr:tRNA (adenosine(37)-N6)-threonylcarbamoyltransferase complex ATPase subunit type 1 TsaE [Treponema sp.]
MYPETNTLPKQPYPDRSAAGLVEFHSDSPEETFALGMRIAGFLKPGSVVALRGCLGSGKTCIAKGIAKGLGINETLTSPTYTIISEYQNDPALYHIDAYRLNNDEDFDNIGGRELISGGGISLIEWSERIQKSLPEDAITVSLEIEGPVSRMIRVDNIRGLK